MINDYKKSRILHFILKLIVFITTVGISVHLLFYVPLYFESTTEVILALVGVFIIEFAFTYAANVLCTMIAMKETKKIFGLLYTDCDPYAYVETYYPIATKQGRKLYYNQLKYNNLSVGYICSGQVDTAINMLQSLQIDSTKKRGVTVQFLCFCNLAHCYLYKNDLEAAQFYLSNAQPLLQKLARGNQKIYNQFLNVYHLNIHNLKLLQGEYIESRAFFEQRFQTAETNYIRIFSAYMLALLYNKTEETEKEQEAIDYIKKHGNKLIYVKLAEELEEKAIQLWKAER